MNDNEESRLARIEKKIDDLIDGLHQLQTTDARQELRIENLESGIKEHNVTLRRAFDRIETLENKPGVAALRTWTNIGSIILSVIVTALVTYILIHLGVKK
jgi:uncharacterized coiled-coil protein SlyX